jgi:peptide/nickel transport system substrate-binding protein
MENKTMREILRKSASPAALLAAMLALGAWSTAAEAAGTLVVDTTFQVKTADPAREFEPTANLFMHAIYQNLITFAGGDLTKLVPSLAELPTISADSRTFTFKLNPNARFSDGSPVTVDDVVFSLNRVANVKGSPSFLMEGVTVAAGANPGEVVLTTANPDPALPFKLTNPALAILNSKVLQANGALADASAATGDKADAFLATASAGSGPYVLTSSTWPPRST